MGMVKKRKQESKKKNVGKQHQLKRNQHHHTSNYLPGNLHKHCCFQICQQYNPRTQYCLNLEFDQQNRMNKTIHQQLKFCQTHSQHILYCHDSRQHTQQDNCNIGFWSQKYHWQWLIDQVCKHRKRGNRLTPRHNHLDSLCNCSIVVGQSDRCMCLCRNVYNRLGRFRPGTNPWGNFCIVCNQNTPQIHRRSPLHTTFGIGLWRKHRTLQGPLGLNICHLGKLHTLAPIQKLWLLNFAQFDHGNDLFYICHRTMYREPFDDLPNNSIWNRRSTEHKRPAKCLRCKASSRWCLGNRPNC
jgi:hypothetical protein